MREYCRSSWPRRVHGRGGTRTAARRRHPGAARALQIEPAPAPKSSLGQPIRRGAAGTSAGAAFRAGAGGGDALIRTRSGASGRAQRDLYGSLRKPIDGAAGRISPVLFRSCAPAWSTIFTWSWSARWPTMIPNTWQRLSWPDGIGRCGAGLACVLAAAAAAGPAKRKPARRARPANLASLVNDLRQSPSPARRAAVETLPPPTQRTTPACWHAWRWVSPRTSRRTIAAAIAQLKKVQGKLPAIADYTAYYLARRAWNRTTGGRGSRDWRRRTGEVPSPLAARAWIVEARALRHAAAEAVRLLRDALRRAAAARRRPHAGRFLPGGQRPGARRRVLPARLLSVRQRATRPPARPPRC